MHRPATKVMMTRTAMAKVRATCSETLAGKEEGAGRNGEEMQTRISPDQAGQMLDGIPVDSHRLSMSDKQGEPPKDKTGRNW